MNKSICKAGLILTLAFLGNAYAQQAFTVDTAVQSAIKNNLTIEQNAIDLQGLTRKKNYSLGSLTPSVSAGVGIGKSNSALTSENYSVFANGTLSVTLSPVIFSSVAQTRLNYEQGLITYETAVRSLELSVRKAFFGLLYEQSFVAYQKRNLETARSQYEQAQAKYREGRVSELDVLQAQVTYENQKPSVLSALIQLDNDMASFKQLIGIQQDTAITLEGSFEPVLGMQGIMTDGIEVNNAQIRALQKSLEQAKQAIQTAQISKWSPALNFSWNYRPQALSGDFGTWNDSGSLSASISFQLDSFFPWSQSGQAVSDAKDTEQKVALQLKDAQTSFAVKTESYMRNIAQTQASIASSRSNVALAEKSYEMMKDAYNKGVKDLLSLQNAADSLLKAQVSLLSDAYSLTGALLDLEYELGVPFGTLMK